MLKLTSILLAREDGLFEQTLKAELENLPAGSLPLQQAANEGGFIDDSNLTVSVIDVEHKPTEIVARIGVFFVEIVANCSCGDEPEEKPAYCQLLLAIDKSTGGIVANLIDN